MKKIIDLTNLTIAKYTLRNRIVPLKQADGLEYNGICTDGEFVATSGSYIDFPGHIDITDDQRTAATVDICDYYRQKTFLIRPEVNADNAITAQALQKAISNMPQDTTMLIINSPAGMGKSHLTLEAADAICNLNLRCLISDTYEKAAYEGVFMHLFRGGVACVCIPDNLDQLPEQQSFFCSVIFLPIPGAVQLPCRVIAELE